MNVHMIMNHIHIKYTKRVHVPYQVHVVRTCMFLVGCVCAGVHVCLCMRAHATRVSVCFMCLSISMSASASVCHDVYGYGS